MPAMEARKEFGLYVQHLVKQFALVRSWVAGLPPLSQSLVVLSKIRGKLAIRVTEHADMLTQVEKQGGRHEG